MLQLAYIQYDLTSCVKVTHHSFMQTSSFNATPQVNIDEFIDANEDEENCPKPTMDDDLLCLQKQNTEILQSRILSKNLETQIKAVSLPNVAFIAHIEDNIKNSRIILKPLKLNHTKRKKKSLKERLLNLQEKSDNLSLGSSFNSYLDCSLSLSSSLDTSLHFRQGSMVSDTSLLSETSNNEISLSEEVVKYLAFRTADVHIYNQVERFKVRKI